jgi:hypothetical protein
MIGKDGPVLGELQVYDDETKEWFSVPIVVSEIKRIISNENPH